MPIPRSAAGASQPREPGLLESTVASPAMARLLLYFATHPWDAAHVRELRRLTGLGMGSLQAELKRLERLGVLTRKPDRNRVRYEVEVADRPWKALRELVAATATPAELLRAAFLGVEGVDAAFVFGSEARGDARPHSDVDLFIIGREDVHHQAAPAFTEIELLLDRALDVVEQTPSRFEARARRRDSRFLQRVMTEPRIWVAGSRDEAEAGRAVA